jgi:hypothetical protein
VIAVAIRSIASVIPVAIVVALSIRMGKEAPVRKTMESAYGAIRARRSHCIVFTAIGVGFGGHVKGLWSQSVGSQSWSRTRS